ncbi:hypothetical protein C8J56DRAFT_143685 [Mycena floridula]|nr:hypothetical protein C8J56DRAFT_143685 [Mycena floridula]
MKTALFFAFIHVFGIFATAEDVAGLVSSSNFSTPLGPQIHTPIEPEAQNKRQILGLLQIRQASGSCAAGFGFCTDSGGGCCPLGGRCCPNGGCCPTGQLCFGDFCCFNSQVGCGNGCCNSGTYCSTAASGQKVCCPTGQVCTGAGSGAAAVAVTKQVAQNTLVHQAGATGSPGSAGSSGKNSAGVSSSMKVAILAVASIFTLSLLM